MQIRKRESVFFIMISLFSPTIYYSQRAAKKMKPAGFPEGQGAHRRRVSVWKVICQPIHFYLQGANAHLQRIL